MSSFGRSIVGTAFVGLLTISSITSVTAHDRFNWSGFYLGGSAGWQGTAVDWNFPNPANSTASTTHSVDSFVLGGHMGYQQQFGRIIVGIEAGVTGRPFDDFDRKESSCAFPAPFDDRCDTNNVGPLYQIGMRLGYTPAERWMIYATGGYAYARIETQIRFGGVGVPPAPNANPVTLTSTGHGGWYLGAGVDYALTKNWLLGLEYQRVELDAEGHCVGGNCNVPSILNRNVDLSADIVRARISYKFSVD